jgi:hypothetical protein
LFLNLELSKRTVWMSLSFWISPLGPHKTECVIYYLVTKARNLAGRALRRTTTPPALLSLSFSLSLSLVFLLLHLPFLCTTRRDATRVQTRLASEQEQVLWTVRPSVRPSSLLSLSLFINLPKAGGPVDEAMFRMREKCRSEQGGTFFACEFFLVSSSSSSPSPPPPFSSSYSSYSSSGRRSGDSEVFADSFVFLMLQVSKY